MSHPFLAVDFFALLHMGDLVVPSTLTSTAQHRCFTAVGPTSWNRLP